MPRIMREHYSKVGAITKITREIYCLDEYIQCSFDDRLMPYDPHQRKYRCSCGNELTPEQYIALQKSSKSILEEEQQQ